MTAPVAHGPAWSNLDRPSTVLTVHGPLRDPDGIIDPTAAVRQTAVAGSVRQWNHGTGSPDQAASPPTHKGHFTHALRHAPHPWPLQLGAVRLVTWHSDPMERVSGGSVPTEPGSVERENGNPVALPGFLR
ncbi:hypothetical protein GQ607_016898 [Colletotrichum asianum]|uniref:Uncharacterized protein n=1 Tax=Colletotrichum asianum TaxID=702518 RepID=A0A8H3ZDU6_9PEZI|nr:hypothetical protein GQ607_016898 [Colletotrichum asianum]